MSRYNSRRLSKGSFPGHGKDHDDGLFPGHGRKHDKVMEKSMTRLWKEAWQGYGKKYDHVMERSMAPAWKEAWPCHGKNRPWKEPVMFENRDNTKQGHGNNRDKPNKVTEITVTMLNKVMERTFKRYIKARPQAEKEVGLNRNFELALDLDVQ